MRKKLSIGEMARLNRISEQTLRLYDKIGLLSPRSRGEDNQYRYYDIRQSAILDVIRYMKSLGMKLSEIKHQLDARNLAYIAGVLQQKQQQIDAEIRQLTLQRHAVQRTLGNIARYHSAPPDGTIMLEYNEQRYLYCINAGVNFYDYEIDVYEMMLRTLHDRLVENQLPLFYFNNAGTLLRRHNLVMERFYSTEVFVFVDKEFVPENLLTTIPAGNYLCIYCDSFYKEEDYARVLLREIREKGYQICGDYICEVISEFPLTDQDYRDLFIRLQIPIRFS